MINNDTDRYAQIIWEYMNLHEDPIKSDAVFCLCSNDTRVAVRAAELLLQGYGKFLIISGGSGKLTKNIFTEPKAKVFEKIAIDLGVKPDRIITEPHSTNTGENIQFSYELLRNKEIEVSSFVLVQKPYMERRTYATFMKQWPDPKPTITVTSPQFSLSEYTREGIPKEKVINIMVGDLQRIQEYPSLGYQIEQEIPSEVWNAYEQLVAVGYTAHLIS